MGDRLRIGVAAGVTALTAWGCASAPVRIPAGPWTIDPAAASAFAEATSSCRGARTLTAEIAVAGRAGGSRLRGRLLAAFERPGRVRLEAVAPFGAPIFILAGRDGRGTLLLPRDRRYVGDADVGDLLEALTGVRRSADDLVALLAGCAVSDARPAPGSRNRSGWFSIPVDSDVTVFLRRESGAWRLRAASHAGAAGTSWLVEYQDFASGFPATVRLREGGATGQGDATSADLTLRISQRDVNVAVEPAAFSVASPAGAAPMTLDELRQLGPLADPASRTRTGR